MITRTLIPSSSNWIALCILCLALPVLSGCDTRPVSESAVTDNEAPPLMTAKRLEALIKQIDPNAELVDNTFRFEAAETVVAVVFDENADRMRIIIPIAPADTLTEAELTRLLQANFDSALDARYAIAQNLVWGTFIHPLSPLTENEFLLGLGQTINVVKTFGDGYSSGLLIFGAGDSAEMQREQMLDFLRRGET